MISVKKDYNQIPSILTGKGCQKKQKEALKEKNQHEFRSYYYANDDVKKALAKIYNGKCAYCESKIGVASFVQVEHYRSKKAVKDVKNHQGYYWLAYEWSNLLAACEQCNIAKSTQFPIKGQRIFSPSIQKANYKATSDYLLAERPYLLNPEIDNPTEHLIFLPNGKIKGITERGKKTIEICKLDRQNLTLARKKIIDSFRYEFIKELKKYQLQHQNQEILEHVLANLVRKLIHNSKNSQAYSGLYWFLVNMPERFFCKGLKQEDVIIIKEAFKKIQSYTLRFFKM